MACEQCGASAAGYFSNEGRSVCHGCFNRQMLAVANREVATQEGELVSTKSVETRALLSVFGWSLLGLFGLVMFAADENHVRGLVTICASACGIFYAVRTKRQARRIRDGK